MDIKSVTAPVETLTVDSQRRSGASVLRNTDGSAFRQHLERRGTTGLSIESGPGDREPGPFGLSIIERETLWLIVMCSS